MSNCCYTAVFRLVATLLTFVLLGGAWVYSAQVRAEREMLKRAVIPVITVEVER